MILGTLNAVLVVKMTPEGGEIDVRVIYGHFYGKGCKKSLKRVKHLK